MASWMRIDGGRGGVNGGLTPSLVAKAPTKVAKRLTTALDWGWDAARPKNGRY